MLRLHDVTRVTATGLVPHSTIDIDNGKITAIYDELLPTTTDIPVYDAKGAYAAPGFVDIHLHGGGGIDFMEATPEQICEACTAHARHGTTTLVPATVTAPTEETLAMIRAVREAQSMVRTCTIAGVHLEGPFLSPVQGGAQDLDTMLTPCEETWGPLLNEWPEGMRIVGVAPEIEGGMAFGEELQKRGIVASIAHSDAEYTDCAEALKHGYTDITHIYSGCSIVHRTNAYRHGGVVEAGLLEDGFTVQVIADGRHLPAELLKLIYKCKGASRISLITDALSPAATDWPEGTILPSCNGEDMILEDGVMKLISREAFAGSIATTDRLVRNMVQLADVPLWDAVAMASTTPARIIGMEKQKGALLQGFDADIVLLTPALQVQAVIARGEFVE